MILDGVSTVQVFLKEGEVNAFIYCVRVPNPRGDSRDPSPQSTAILTMQCVAFDQQGFTTLLSCSSHPINTHTQINGY